MNIFFLSRDIEENARFHCNAHVVKMILEYAQLLCSVHHSTGSGTPDMYKLTHKNHPDAVWARSSLENYEYLISLAVLLGEEYTFRYGKTHKSIGLIERLPIPELVSLGFTEPPKCVHDDFKGFKDTVQAYRAYYIRDKGHFCRWTKRGTPYWFSRDYMAEIMNLNDKPYQCIIKA